MKVKTTQKSNLQNQQSNENEIDVDNDELPLLVMAKKLGLSFQELNLMSLQDLIDFVDLYTGNSKKGNREATQKDIDSFFSN